MATARTRVDSRRRDYRRVLDLMGLSKPSPNFDRTDIAVRWSIRNQILIPLDRHPGVAVTVADPGHGDARRPAERAADHRPLERRRRHPRARELPLHGERAGEDAGPLRGPLRRVCGGRPRDGDELPEPRTSCPPSLRSAPAGGAPRLAGRIADGRPERHPLLRGAAPAGGRLARLVRSWCSTPRPVGGRRGGRPRCRP